MEMAMNCIKSLRSIIMTKEGVVVKKSFKRARPTDAPKSSTLSKEVKTTTVVKATILKDGVDPKI
ncbi:hypothetical protein ACSBR2_022525 [Camellia fascicularis]